MSFGDLLEERQEFAVTVPLVAGVSGDLPGRYLQGSDKVVVPCRL
jgi:hypothetical protein